MATKYSLVMRVIHWLMAIMIIAMLASGLYMKSLEPSDFKYQIYGIHKSFGVILLFLIMLRIYVRFKSAIPALPKQIKKLEKKLAAYGTAALYIAMVIMPLSGYIMSNAKGHAVKLFSFKMPDIANKDEMIGKLAAMTHEYLAFFLIALIAIHFLAVVKHYFIDKNNLLKRML